MSRKTDKYALRFNWAMKMACESAEEGATPRALLLDWFSIHYLDFFQASNTAEVLEGFRKKLVARQVRGCTIDDINAQVKRLISENPILLWSQPNERGLSRKEILIKWLETNYSAYVGSTNPAKLSMMKAPRDEIQRAGFPLCALRDLRAMISTLTTIDHRSIYVRVLSNRLDRILESVQARPDDRIEVKAEPMDLDGQHNQDDSVMTTHSETRVRRRMVTSRSYLQVSEPHDVVMKESEHDNVEEETHPHGQEGGMQSDTGARVKIEWPGTQSTPIPIDCDEDESGGNDTATGSATSRPSSYPFDEDELNTRELVALGRKLLLDRGVPIEEVDVLVPDPQRLVSRMLRYPFSPAEIQLRTKLGWKRQRLRTMGVQASAIDACLPMPSP